MGSLTLRFVTLPFVVLAYTKRAQPARDSIRYCDVAIELGRLLNATEIEKGKHTLGENVKLYASTAQHEKRVCLASERVQFPPPHSSQPNYYTAPLRRLRTASSVLDRMALMPNSTTRINDYCSCFFFLVP